LDRRIPFRNLSTAFEDHQIAPISRSILQQQLAHTANEATLLWAARNSQAA
jgi:hypothetical protein